MKTILVAGSKGGVGKTTLATNLAARYAVDGKRTVLVDADRQASSMHWCEKRAGMDAAVLPVDGTRRDWKKEIPDDTQRVIVDSRAGAMADELVAFLEAADAVLVPVLPSTVDIEATVPFLDSLAEARARAQGQTQGRPCRQPHEAVDECVAACARAAQGVAVSGGGAIARHPGLRAAGRPRAGACMTIIPNRFETIRTIGIPCSNGSRR